ncbi:MAG: gliding motility-associated protein GldC [Saprospiraceae bacterium]
MNNFLNSPNTELQKQNTKKSINNHMKVKHHSKIKINVGLDENKVPIKIEWEASDNPNEGGTQECKAFLLSIFDKETKDTMKVDLWTTEMQVNEMDRFFFQTLRAMADTYFKATQNKELAGDMQRFVQYFGEQTEIIPKG